MQTVPEFVRHRESEHVDIGMVSRSYIAIAFRLFNRTLFVGVCVANYNQVSTEVEFALAVNAYEQALGSTIVFILLVDTSGNENVRFMLRERDIARTMHYAGKLLF